MELAEECGSAVANVGTKLLWRRIISRMVLQKAVGVGNIRKSKNITQYMAVRMIDFMGFGKA